MENFEPPKLHKMETFGPSKLHKMETFGFRCEAIQRTTHKQLEGGTMLNGGQVPISEWCVSHSPHTQKKAADARLCAEARPQPTINKRRIYRP